MGLALAVMLTTDGPVEELVVEHIEHGYGAAGAGAGLKLLVLYRDAGKSAVPDRSGNSTCASVEQLRT